jgi:hypothetical protein
VTEGSWEGGSWPIGVGGWSFSKEDGAFTGGERLRKRSSGLSVDETRTSLVYQAVGLTWQCLRGRFVRK